MVHSLQLEQTKQNEHWAGTQAKMGTILFFFQEPHDTKLSKEEC